VLHIHVLLVAPLGASYMAEPGTDQHQSRIAIREAAHYSGAAADLPVEPFNDIVGTDTSPVFAGKVAIGQRLFNTILYLKATFQDYSLLFLFAKYRNTRSISFMA